jgi:hypothetical protein
MSRSLVSKLIVSLATLAAAFALSTAANAGAFKDARHLAHDRGELRFNKAERFVDRFEKQRDIRRFENAVGHGNIGAAIHDEMRIHNDNRRIRRDNFRVGMDRFEIGNDRRRLNNDFNNF